MALPFALGRFFTWLGVGVGVGLGVGVGVGLGAEAGFGIRLELGLYPSPYPSPYPLALHLTLERVELQRLFGCRRHPAVADGPREGDRAVVLLARVGLTLWDLGGVVG